MLHTERIMALIIKHPEAELLARELAACTAKTLTEAVLTALRERLKREQSRVRNPKLADELRAISDRCGALPDLDTRTPEEIIGYDEHGIPQ